MTRKLLYLINPSNDMVSILKVKESWWNRFRVWKPLGLMVIAGLTPDDWDIKIVDENLGIPDYSLMQKPDLVGITAFTSQAPRAYELATLFRRAGVPVVIGGIHATMCREEASRYADTVVTGEAENVWETVLTDFRQDRLNSLYEGGFADMAEMSPARHDLLDGKYAFGAIQTTRGCPLHCSFCSVTSFNGARFRQRPIEQVIAEFQRIPENLVLIVDDNLIGTRREHINRSKALFRAMIRSRVKKKWVAQATINVANDDELLSLASAAGCKGLFIGFESTNPEELKGLSGKRKLCKFQDLKKAVKRIQKNGIIVAGSFIIGLDNDKQGVGYNIAETANEFGVDFVNVLLLTPLPGTQVWDELESQNRMLCKNFPQDWKYFTLTYPVAEFVGITSNQAAQETLSCSAHFYTARRIFHRLLFNLWRGQSVAIGLAGSLSYLSNIKIDHKKLEDFMSRDHF